MKKFEFFEIFVREDEIVQITLYPNIDVTPEHVKIMVDAILDLNNGKQSPVIMFIGEFSTFSKEAREYTADPKNENATTALAYVIDNFGHKLVINFFIKINKPVKPIKIFTDEKQAVNWLSQYK